MPRSAPARRSTARPAPSTMRGRVQSVEKALRLLQTLDRQGDWLGVRDLARQLGMSAPATHSLLKTLQAAGFVETNPDTRQYRLGLAALRLGNGLDPLPEMRRFARPYCEMLADKSDETVVVLAWQHDHVVVVDWIQTDHALAVTHRHGVIAHPIGYASGRALLAHLEPGLREHYARGEDYAQLGANSPRNPAELLALLAQVADDGCAVTENVGESGVTAVGAPVFDASGRILIAIGCSAPLSRVTPTRLRHLKARVREVAAEMSARLRAPDAKSAR
ncbi:MAG: IclR family transcriptional regulator [Opitutaceae bacterium]|nr:IclR family transcriptional regulator [Opitutaceae bacterium]